MSGVAQRERTRSPAATVHPLVARRELVHRRDLGRIQIDLRVDPPSRGCRRGSVEETSWASSSLTVSYFIRTTEEKGVRACAQQQKRKESKYYESMENIGGGQDDGVQREKKAVGRGSRHDDGRFVYYSSRPPSPPPRHPERDNTYKISNAHSHSMGDLAAGTTKAEADVDSRTTGTTAETVFIIFENKPKASN